MKKNKKAQLQNVTGYVVSFVLIGLMVAVGLIVVDKFTNAVRTDTAKTNGTFTNNTLMPYYPVRSVSGVLCNHTLSMGAEAVANWVFSDDIIVVHNSTSCLSGYSADYVYSANTSASKSLVSTTNAVSPITSDWLPILVIVAIVGVVLALIMGAFSFYKNRG